MSIHLMTKAFKTTIPTTQKFVFVALCDNANDQGECYPSVQMICAKTSLKERAVRSAFKWLVEHGFMFAERRKGASNYFYIAPPDTWSFQPEVIHTPCTSCTPALNAPLHNMQDSPAPDAPPPLHNMHPTPASDAPITIIEPSIEPSGNRQNKSVSVFDARVDEYLPATHSPVVKPSPSKPKFDPAAKLHAFGCDEQVIVDFLAHRKAKKAQFTQTALNGFIREAQKAGISLNEALTICCERGWIGFKADWHQKDAPKSDDILNRIRQPSVGSTFVDITPRKESTPCLKIL